MKDKLLQFCREQQLLSPGDTVICAVSGGADSMAMLLLLHSLRQELGIIVSAAHFNHHLRGEASDGDEAFVRDFCEKRQIFCHSGSGDVAAYAKTSGLSLEEAARALRYSFFAALPGLVATAHTADDNAETVFMNLIRGSGLKGLSGIPPKRDRMIRPMLPFTRVKVEAYLRAADVPWREDGSNHTDFCRRNRIRHHVIPLLREENPALSRTVLAESLLLREEDAFLDTMAEQEAEKAARPDGWDCKTLLSLPPVLLRRVLILLLRRHEIPWDLGHVEALRQQLNGSGRLSLPGGWEAVQSCGLLQFTCQEAPALIPRLLPVPGELLLPECALRITCALQADTARAAEDTLLLDAGSVPEVITVRSRRTGDAIALPGGTRSLKRLMIDRKIPVLQRDLLPVLAAEDRILAVYSLGVGRDYLPKPGNPVLAVQFQSYE